MDTTIAEVLHNSSGESADSKVSNSDKVLFKNQRPLNYATGSLVGAFLLFLFIVVKDAWLSDDAYISLRTVDNWLHGYGLTWNIDERVQTYTHPLWFFMLAGANLLERNVYFSALLLSLVVSVAAVLLLIFRLAPSLKMALVALAAMTASKAFVDFSTSGLENPMTHLLIVVFALLYFRYQHKERYVLWISLLGCAMILNRMDTVLLFVPTLAWAFWQRRSWRTLWTMALSFIPFLLWEVFSLFYYGFLFPNTAYAKLNTGVPANELFAQGVGYLVSSFTFDPVLFLVIAAGILFMLARRDWKSLPLLLGMLLYLFYTVRVGGDFMAGRFLTPPLLIAIILLMRNLPENTVFVSVAIATLLLIGVLVTNSRIYAVNVDTVQADLIDTRGVADERLWYVDRTGLLNYTRTNDLSNPPSTYANVHTLPDRIHVEMAVGLYGYTAGPKVHVLDMVGLGDPLLARLPAIQQHWRIGHFKREIPYDYIKTLQTGRNHITDRNLAEYYTHLHNVTSGDLFSWSRLVDIWNLNLGTYNHLLPPAAPQ
ncbi:hypothetical protein [Dictyobacter aurantiacus]|uniref:Glycosyltransferase RgtA/B/C/D-like domain-containing protein n=1 Tax=Dictyobacter aurantiacus TaxID=1936993 RepID=A0A401ZK15_9CHLR|nr:hypothetical protein [Dictyobacter aurantiacus]GCE07170.1 hypothetical protein KDAU_44990 [Dictyobacter aurantiacus]